MTVSADKSNWPELAGAKLAESNGSGRKPHIDARNVGPESSEVDGDDRVDANARFVPGVRRPRIGPRSSASNSVGEHLDSTRCDANVRTVPGYRKPYIDPSDVELSSSSVADDGCLLYTSDAADE